MQKFAIITTIATLTMVVTTIASSAAFVAAPRTPRNTPAVSHTECGDSLGHFRSVNRADIESIDGQNVMLIRVCDDGSLASNDSYGSLFINGNVETLRMPIARNYTLMSALDEEGLDQNDVVSLQFGANDSVVLYVYDRFMR
ncbi:MAG: hypothetical protein JWR51_3716 [Devosia sp.]|uniref:hypothetical protein n=1 Tax=Devosia sp. TaxID=1871048 RepID=UPI00260A2B27|nr:hypothetical protein [Devosia sp.]MDB5530613.1 hypothetical protein [Devosia sp.]